eukprot:NODE_3469_length_971_cov_10.455531_g3184_i0.p1 GENE.NODE_3469_length_971_cov_10.455531_g3184_i0~~NODE_3469_length_971_cov_10.455531_g3184_i0.p1  ORF type:complete len:144 (-),score=30.82 NODE_3469_length_971_cov_10.455531_g3184_i0:16-447(-)
MCARRQLRFLTVFLAREKLSLLRRQLIHEVDDYFLHHIILSAALQRLTLRQLHQLQADIEGIGLVMHADCASDEGLPLNTFMLRKCREAVLLVLRPAADRDILRCTLQSSSDQEAADVLAHFGCNSVPLDCALRLLDVAVVMN